jgi:hypothetical protein
MSHGTGAPALVIAKGSLCVRAPGLLRQRQAFDMFVAYGGYVILHALPVHTHYDMLQ